ncbi:hypothetical protein TVAG_183050 [Trichomonas vaginalis G3]|uniref:RNA polymerase Rpb4/RPC9 core domain-containing protein n=1 Tax=Trichomonas vaginalis (strain ATCC PRA-98 / G3) TaxID=412133 RepID=A2D943_TRIV3|nr:HRDC-like family [Trichomonas vaginalis G3]EAY23069.1 hypothetical protein TVAG_183050 [Trichomonas vaginalis G3]KAI5519037.1 HRDC-like family [Trichomonas vaginalis G3]|eukprot:XP_001584055.1 hypothetical protein [Trichomonas vaginalis G3]
MATQIKYDEKFITENVCLTNFEVAQRLKSSAFEANQNDDLIGQSYEYALEFSHFQNAEDLESIKSYLSDVLSPYEIVTLCNLVPQDAAMAKLCCASLERISDETLQSYLTFIRGLVRSN